MTDESKWACKYDTGMGYYYECPKCKFKIDAKDVVMARKSMEACPKCGVKLNSDQNDYDRLIAWLQEEEKEAKNGVGHLF